jgi:hypothetical protein
MEVIRLHPSVLSRIRMGSIFTSEFHVKSQLLAIILDIVRRFHPLPQACFKKNLFQSYVKGERFPVFWALAYVSPLFTVKETGGFPRSLCIDITILKISSDYFPKQH